MQDTTTPLPNPFRMEVSRMARAIDHHIDPQPDRQHDGALRCRLCVHGRPGEDHDWCPAVEAVVCEDCCAALSSCDIRTLLAASTAVDRPITPMVLLSACTDCDRLSADDGPREGPGPDEAIH
jgi:hypothetical protein